MKRNILILFAVVSLLINLTGCGSSGHSNSVAPTPTAMTSVKVCLTQNEQPATGADVTLYTPAAAMREGLTQAQTNTTNRASMGLNNGEGVYKPTSTSSDGTYTFTVPTGEYTLIANKGTARAVVTDIRAVNVSEEQENTSITVEKLKPTGTITGKVTAPTNVTDFNPGGIFVYLGNTSLVAFTNSEGRFTITGVPTDTEYTIVATAYQNGKIYKYTSAEPIKVDSKSGYELDAGSLSLQNDNSSKFKITATVTDANAYTAFMITNGVDLYAGNVDNGGFAIDVKSAGNYVVTVIGSNEGSLPITVNPDSSTSPENLSFTMATLTEAYASVKGNIKYDQQYDDYINSEDLEVPDVDRYLVQLIGVDGTAYRTQTKSDYKFSDPSTFMFDNVYPGTYTILVDPAGNGFVGSIGTFSVKAGEILDLGLTATASVIYVKPGFKANAFTSYVRIVEDYPFVSDPSDIQNELASVTVKDLSDGSYVSANLGLVYATTDSSHNEYHIIKKDDNSFYLPTHNGKYEIIVQKSWYDSNTGLSGTLTATDIVDYNPNEYDSNPRPLMYFGNLVLNYQNFQFTVSIKDIKYEIIKDFGVCYSAYDSLKNLYYSSGTLYDSFNDEETLSSGDTLDLSGIFALVSNEIAGEDNSYQLTCHKMGNTTTETPFVSVSRTDTLSGSIVANKYIALCYNENYSNREVKLYSHKYDKDNGTTTITPLSYTFTEEDYFPIEVKLTHKATDNDFPINEELDDCYLAVLYMYSGNGNKSKIVIYDLKNMNNNNGVIAECELDGFKNESLSYLSRFNCLRNNTFYVETYDPLYPSFIVNSQGLVDKSSIRTRESCFTMVIYTDMTVQPCLS